MFMRNSGLFFLVMSFSELLLVLVWFGLVWYQGSAGLIRNVPSVLFMLVKNWHYFFLKCLVDTVSEVT